MKNIQKFQSDSDDEPCRVEWPDITPEENRRRLKNILTLLCEANPANKDRA